MGPLINPSILHCRISNVFAASLIDLYSVVKRIEKSLMNTTDLLISSRGNIPLQDTEKKPNNLMSAENDKGSYHCSPSSSSALKMYERPEADDD